MRAGGHHGATLAPAAARRKPEPEARRAGIPQPKATPWEYAVAPTSVLKGRVILPLQGRGMDGRRVSQADGLG